MRKNNITAFNEKCSILWLDIEIDFIKKFKFLFVYIEFFIYAYIYAGINMAYC